jgi:hypothetical protein
MLTPFGSGIWLADGPVVKAALGFRYPTRMALVRLDNGGLWVWSPVALTEGLRAEIAALGPVAHLVAPNHLHHVFLGDWAAAFPEARVHAPPGLRAKRPDLRLDADLGAGPAPGWAGQIDQVLVDASPLTTEAVFFHRASGTALVCDLLQQFPPGWHRGWRALLARMDNMIGFEPAMPVKFRLAVRAHSEARAALEQVRDWPVQRLVMAHGTPVTIDARRALDQALRDL